MDSSGIGVVLGRYRQMRDRGGQVGAIHMNHHVSRIFHMSGMDRVIRQLDKQEAAQ
jgi:stage II sporulation protein AA (anti-sigma F factor antagonist)